MLFIYRYPEATALVQRLITTNPKHSLALLLLARVKADTYEANIGTAITLNNTYDMYIHKHMLTLYMYTYVYMCIHVYSHTCSERAEARKSSPRPRYCVVISSVCVNGTWGD